MSSHERNFSSFLYIFFCFDCLFSRTISRSLRTNHLGTLTESKQELAYVRFLSTHLYVSNATIGVPPRRRIGRSPGRVGDPVSHGDQSHASPARWLVAVALILLHTLFTLPLLCAGNEPTHLRWYFAPSCALIAFHFTKVSTPCGATAPCAILSRRLHFFFRPDDWIIRFPRSLIDDPHCRFVTSSGLDLMTFFRFTDATKINRI